MIVLTFAFGTTAAACLTIAVMGGNILAVLFAIVYGGLAVHSVIEEIRIRQLRRRF